MESTVDQCPLCGTQLSRVKFREIESKLREEEQRMAAKRAQAETAIRLRLEQQFKLEIEKQKRAAENKAMEKAEQQIKKVAAERDELVKKLKDANEREMTILQQAQAEAEKARQKELAEQHEAMEKEKALALMKQQAAAQRDRDSLIKKVQGLESRLKKKTANELGDAMEIDVYEALREHFPGDKITRIAKGQSGADILHEVLYKGESCGKIIVDSKNRLSWQNGYVAKLRQDQVEAVAEHAILATTVFPVVKKELCIESGVIVIAPARVIYIVELLRQAMVTMHVKGLSLKERASKMAQLYSLITSDSYTAKLAEANKLTRDMGNLETQEKTAHDNVWKKRGALVKRMQSVLRDMETEVAAIIERGAAEETPIGTVSGDGHRFVS